MSGSSRWRCPRCKVDRDSVKKIDIWKLPRILLIGLNRFLISEFRQMKITQNSSNLAQQDITQNSYGCFIIISCITILALIFFNYMPESKIQKNFLFIQTNYFIIFTCQNPVLLVPGFGQVGQHDDWFQSKTME